MDDNTSDPGAVGPAPTFDFLKAPQPQPTVEETIAAPTVEETIAALGEAIACVELAREDLGAERSRLVRLGWRIERERAEVDGPQRAEVDGWPVAPAASLTAQATNYRKVLASLVDPGAPDGVLPPELTPIDWPALPAGLPADEPQALSPKAVRVLLGEADRDGWRACRLADFTAEENEQAILDVEAEEARLRAELETLIPVAQECERLLDHAREQRARVEAHLDALRAAEDPIAARYFAACETGPAEDAETLRERSAMALALAAAGTPFPEPFRGPMTSAVEAALRAAYRPQPALTALAALVGMAACIPGHYRLPDGGRLNVYGLGALETGGGKDFPRRVAQAIADNAGATVIGGPASGQALEDALVADRPMLVEVDEVAHVLAAMTGSTAPAYTVELGRRLLALFSASAGVYHCRARAAPKQSAAGSAPRSLRNPCVSFLGFATPEKLGEALTVGNIEDGLLGRMLFGFGDATVKQRRVTVAFALPADFDRYRDGFAPSLAVAGPEVVVRYGPGAEAMHDRLIDDFEADTGGSPFAKALRQRAVEKVLRVAGVLACFDDPQTPVMNVEHLDWATELVRASNCAVEQFVDRHMHGGAVQANAARVLNLIDRIVAGGMKAQSSTQLAAVRAGAAPRSLVLKLAKLDARTFGEAVAHLIATGDVTGGTVKTEDGRGIACLRRASE